MACVIGWLLACTGTTGAGPVPDASPDRAAPPPDSATRDDATVTPIEDASLVPDADASPPPDAMPMPTGVPIFMAQGYMGRTIISCDEGRSWVHEQFAAGVGITECGDPTTARCMRNGCDCDHNTGAAKGVAYRDGWFYALFGWGTPSTVWRTQNGIDWETELLPEMYGGIAAGNDVLLLGNRRWRRIPSGAMESEGLPYYQFQSSTGQNVNAVRRMFFSPVNGGVFLTFASNAARALAISRDDGQSWASPRSLPDECTDNLVSVASSNTSVVMMNRRGVVCQSDDGGDTWTRNNMGEDIFGGPVWVTGRATPAFLAWSQDRVYESTDGKSWASTETSPGRVRLEHVAVSDSGAFVANLAGFNNWYENQAMYYSADGVTWTRTADDKFPGGHRIRYIAFGYADPSACE
ncbi:MAG: hypothetical protein AAGF12_06670 [Myxococcota bacterium]